MSSPKHPSHSPGVQSSGTIRRLAAVALLGLGTLYGALLHGAEVPSTGKADSAATPLSGPAPDQTGGSRAGVSPVTSARASASAAASRPTWKRCLQKPPGETDGVRRLALV